VVGASLATGVLMPYEQWYVPRSQWMQSLQERLRSVGYATPAGRPDALLNVAQLYLSEGMAPEALSFLQMIRAEAPEYFAGQRLGVLAAACNVLMDRPEDAASALSAPELENVPEAALWRQVVAIQKSPPSPQQPDSGSSPAGADNADAKDALESSRVAREEDKEDAAAPSPRAPTATTPTHVFQFLKFNKPYIRFYPPKIRQKLTVMAADSYLMDGQPEKALAAYDMLVRDGIIGAVKPDADIALAIVTAEKGDTAKALKSLDTLAGQTRDLRVAAKARHRAILLRLKKDMLTLEEAAELLELARMGWRGDAVEREILRDLQTIYAEDKRYPELLRTKREIVEAFPNDPNMLALAGDMSELFQRIFLEDIAPDLQPLQALSLFYEFRTLTPLGDQGDAIIQNLADRLVAIDLIDRAAQLLDHQLKFRTEGSVRSQIGTKLALLHLLNQRPQEALSVLEVSNFGGNSPALQLKRQQLTAQTLAKLEKYEEALSVLYTDRSAEGDQLRLEILWEMEDWPNVVNRAEEILSNRTDLTAPLEPRETETLLKLALAYAFESDYVQLRYLRDYYGGLIPDSGYKQIFDFLTNDTTPLDTEDFALVGEQLNRTESFLDAFRSKIAESKLSEVLPSE
jgi:tetratricopeptide (TPR) repeat protein